MVPPAQASALLGEMAAVVRTIFAVHAPTHPTDAPALVPAAPVPSPSPVAAAPAPAPAPLATIPLPELDELAFLDE